jgi:hypothetical protein
MTNPYPDNASNEEKIWQELRCIRCVLERMLMRNGDYTDYQMEKFGKDFKGDSHQRKNEKHDK